MNPLDFCNRSIINPNDPLLPTIEKSFSQAIIEADLNQSLIYDIIKPDGMARRNGSMVLRGLNVSQKKQLSMIVQSCGLDHIFGNIIDKDPFRTSLSALFASKGAKPLPIFTVCEKSNYTPERIIPDGAFEEFPRSIIFRNMDDTHHIRDTELGDGSDHVHKLRQAWSGADTAHWIAPSNRPALPLPELIALYNDLIARAEQTLG